MENLTEPPDTEGDASLMTCLSTRAVCPVNSTLHERFAPVSSNLAVVTSATSWWRMLMFLFACLPMANFVPIKSHERVSAGRNALELKSISVNPSWQPWPSMTSKPYLP